MHNLDPLHGRIPGVAPKKKGTHFVQGHYVPKNPDKYVGDITKIRYMSSWELRVHQFFDNNSNVILWGSETVIIPYLKPTTGKIHRYFVDYWVQFRDKNGNIRTELIEVKPLAQTKSPRKNHKHALYEQLTYAINVAKWTAASQYAKSKGWTFRLVTENSIFM